eukprot:GHRR01009650.1.p1 GENE.GHRR01009650.1~~GHRR01009650.1.p1  ORF type:complete len:462 (+),score=180.56 GHRR01009650.1:154-1386(+)
MGGHGGLNILPQKRWNVYNRDNRLKVARDEAQHNARERELQGKHRVAEAQARRHLLLERARERRTAVLGITSANVDEEGDVDAAAGADTQHTLASAHEQDDDWREQHHQQQMQALQQPQPQRQRQGSPEKPVLEHINFWKDLEAKAQHPERVKEQRDEKKRRGNPDTHTSDARFDESFKLDYGLSGSKPWYARPAAPVCVDDMEIGKLQQQTVQYPVLQLPATGAAAASPPALLASNGKSKRRKQQASNNSVNVSSGCNDDSNSSSSSYDGSESDSGPGHKQRRKHSGKEANGSSSKHSSFRRSRKEKSSRKDKRKHNSKHKHREKSSAAAAASGKKSLELARLRAERLDREAAERQRSLQATGQWSGPHKRYNNSFGYAEALKGGSNAAAAARGASAASVNGLQQRFRG